MPQALPYVDWPSQSWHRRSFSPSLPFAQMQYSGHIGATENKELDREVNDEESDVPIFLAMVKEMAKEAHCR
jgi:hypothetical protein